MIEKSYWREAYGKSLYPSLTEELETDVVIVGGGITGLTAAYLLKKSGLKVAVIEKDTIGGGTTGRTTGKVTSQHGLIYADFRKQLGDTKARLYGEANQAAVAKVDEIVRRESIECSWQRDDNYVYTSSEGQVEEFKEEAQAASELGLPASFETGIPLPFEVKAAVKFAGQGKIHSQKYVLGLAEIVNGDGSYVFEHSKALGIRDGKVCRVRTRHGTVTARHIIVATNVPTMPLMARGAYCLLEYPTESYLVAGRLNRDFEGMYISPDSDNYSILPFEDEGEKYLLVGGEGHISGFRGSRQARFDRLEAYARKHFGLEKIDYRWSDRDYLTYDGPPLAGKAYPWSKNLYVASAFRKWGLSNGTASAMILHDLITDKPNPWSPVFTPNRLKPIASIPRVAAKYLTGQS